MDDCCPYQRLKEFLQRETLSIEREAERSWIAEIDARKNCANIGEFSKQQLDLLHLRRASVSNSLLKSYESITRWNQAQRLILTWIESNKVVSLPDLIQLNTVISGGKNSSWRTVDIYTTRVKHIEPKFLDKIMQDFWQYFESVFVEQHIIYAAFVCRYWILSIHPFLEANGRTSQLFADYFLLKHGYLPQAFTSKLEAFIIGDPDTKPYNTFHEGFRRFCQTIINAYKICLSPI